MAQWGYTFVSEARPKGILKRFPNVHNKDAASVAGQVRQLVTAGIPAGNIIVVGCSRGGLLTLMVSSMLGPLRQRIESK